MRVLIGWNRQQTHHDNNTITCSIDIDDFIPTGTWDGFVKITAVDFRHYEKKHTFVWEARSENDRN